MDDTWQVEAGGLKASWMREAEGFERCQEAMGPRDWKVCVLAIQTELGTEGRSLRILSSSTGSCMLHSVTDLCRLSASSVSLGVLLCVDHRCACRGQRAAL